MLATLLAAALAILPVQAPLRTRVADPDLIRAAVKEALAASPQPGGLQKSTVLGSDANAGFARAVDEARVPDCLHPDALKHQPPKLGPVDIGGVLALPFWISAIVRGKCN